MGFDFDDFDDENEFVEAGGNDAEEDLSAPAQQTAAEKEFREAQAKAVAGMLKRNQFLRQQHYQMVDWCSSRFTADRWLAENEREWHALDRMCASRPWATNKDTAFPYPFKEATKEMRQMEGQWVGDDKPRVPDTRGKVGHEVLTQVHPTEEFPPEHRVVLFAPEFGSAESFHIESWKNIQPQGNVDIWVVCWQGWSDFWPMIEQLTSHLASFADGVSTTWVGQGMGALVAYEILKYMEEGEMQSPNLPVALVTVDCPAPHQFSDLYKPYDLHRWEKDLAACPPEVQGRVTSCVGVMRSYKCLHAKSQASLPIPLRALCHSGMQLFQSPVCKEWDRYANAGDFEYFELGKSMNSNGTDYLQGLGAARAEQALLSAVSAACVKYDRWIADGKFPDIGPTDSPMPEKVDCVVVGAGISGVYQGAALVQAGKSVIILDRYHTIGGVWQFYGNDYSRVNTSEIGYRIVEKTGTWSRTNEDHSPRKDILRDIHTVASRHCYGMIHCNINVVKVDKKEDGSYEVHVKNITTGAESVVKAGLVTFHVNRRIGKRREVDWPRSDEFKGSICYGYGNEVKKVKFWGQKVLIVGAGAFAFENVRTALEHGARHVTLMGRRDGTTCPKWIDMLAFLRPRDQFLLQQKGADMVSFAAWQKCYLDAGLHTPQCWEEGLQKPNNHTISVSDLAFIAGFHGLFSLKVGEIDHVSGDGLGVNLKDGSKISCDIIIKCTGFHLNTEVPEVTGYKKMQPYGLLDFNLNYSAEPLLDGGQFGGTKDKQGIDVEQGFDYTDYLKGLEMFKTLGMDEKAITIYGNPFGSGQGGPIVYQSKYLAWLATHPEEQQALLKHGGSAPQDVVDLWASQIGQYSNLILTRLIASLASIKQ